MGCCYTQGFSSSHSITRSQLALKSCTLRIVEGDISSQTADAIVNSTNSTLSADVGEAKAIASKGGIALKAECVEYVNEHGFVQVAETVVTGAGDLQSKHVIHVVAPVYVNGRRGEPESLRTAVHRVLETAVRLNCASLALPAVSASAYAYPKSECAAILLDSVQLFLRTKTHSFTEISFVSSDRLTIRQFCKALDRIKRDHCVDKIRETCTFR